MAAWCEGPSVGIAKMSMRAPIVSLKGFKKTQVLDVRAGLYFYVSLLFIGTKRLVV